MIYLLILVKGEFVLPADVVRYHGLEKIMGILETKLNKAYRRKWKTWVRWVILTKQLFQTVYHLKEMAVGGDVRIPRMPTMPIMPRPPINDPNAPKAPGTVTTPRVNRLLETLLIKDLFNKHLKLEYLNLLHIEHLNIEHLHSQNRNLRIEI